MNAYFCKQLAAYARHHCSVGNCAMHWLGIPAIFFAVLVVLAARPVPIGSGNIGLGTLLLIPATMLWLALDAGVGGTLLIVIVPLAVAAEWIAHTSEITLILVIASAAFVAGWLCLIVGHRLFERRRPAFIDDLSLLFIGPMFIVAKALVALGLRRDLAPSLDETIAPQI
jgi:uncharacterized membrane protein YGL010W